MDEQTLTALKGSIAKWEAIVAGTGEDHGQSNCPLCQTFDKTGLCECNGCPVANATGYPGCSNSPYNAWIALDPDRLLEPEDQEERDAAIGMLNFLRSLLPEDVIS